MSSQVLGALNYGVMVPTGSPAKPKRDGGEYGSSSVCTSLFTIMCGVLA